MKGKRFTVGHQNDISQGEAQRRRDALQTLFERQKEVHGMDRWANWVLPYADQIAKGQQIIFEVSDEARRNIGQASEEAILLDRLKSVGLAIAPTDPQVIAHGERQLREWIDDRVRAAVTKTIAATTDHMGLPESLAERVTGSLPDPTETEVRTLHDALEAYRQHVRKTGNRQDDGQLAPSPRKYIDWTHQLQKNETDFPMWELEDKARLEELIGKWRNRPVSSTTKARISKPHAKHLIDALWAALTHIDESAGWRWNFPSGARRIKRTPIRLDSDRKKSQTRRIEGMTYKPDQLATIARQLNPVGKLMLGLGVNCAMQPAEFGRVEIGDFFTIHPETAEPANWIIFDRPKTHEYGGWLLWDEVASLVRWGIRRAKHLNSERIVVQDNGKPWYNESNSHPNARIGKWWQGKRTKSDPYHVGVVTKLKEGDKDFPRHTIKTLRKILPNLVRPDFGKDVADLVNARHVDGAGRINGADTDRYSDRPYDGVAKAIRHFESHFRPFLDALAEDFDESSSKYVRP